MNMLALFEKLEVDNKKLIVIGVVFVFIVFIDIGFLMSGQLKGIKSSFEKITKLKKDIASAEAELAKAKGQPQEQSKPGTVKKLIFEEQLPELLQHIYSAANKNKINIAQIRPSREVKQKKDAKNAPPAKGQKMFIKLDVSGDFHQFGKFLNDLENAEQFMSVDEIRIVPNPDSLFVQNESVTISTYVKK